jgi:GxxExxY protein
MYTNSKSTLTPELDALIARIVACAIAVHRVLGPGFLESIYAAALCYELTQAGIRYERERSVYVAYKELTIPGQRVDLIVDARVIVEIKAVNRMDAIFQAKLISYLRTTGLRAGLLINFNEYLVKDGIKRIVL